jgi:hypothetical protein
MKPFHFASSFWLLVVSPLTASFALQTPHPVKCKASILSAAPESAATSISAISDLSDNDPHSHHFACIEGDRPRPISAARRKILMKSIQSATASLALTSLASCTFGVEAALADGDTFDDLSMPTDEQTQLQQPKNEVSTRKERRMAHSTPFSSATLV